MNQARLVEFQDAFAEPHQDWRSYLTGIDNATLLLAATHFLGRLNAGPRGYYEDMQQIFGPHSEDAARSIFVRLSALEHQHKAVLSVVHPKNALRLFEYAMQRTDEPLSKTEAESELSIFKSFVAQNDEFNAEQDVAIAALATEKGLSQLAGLSLLSAHSDFELVNFNTPRVLLIQLLKAVQLFQFLESNTTYQPLLTAFLQHYNCSSWQDYMRRLMGFVQAIIYAEKSGRTEVHIPRDADFEATCAFLDKLTLDAEQQLLEHDFVSTRARPIYKLQEGVYSVVFPVFVAEMLHKGLFFQLLNLAESTSPQLLKGWSGLYKQEFSEDYLLGNLLDFIFLKRGLAWSGKRIKNGKYLAGKGDAEPDYYFRGGKRVILFESKDVNVASQVKAGQDFPGFLEAVRKRFYWYLDGKGKRKEVGIMQLLHNIKRLLSSTKELSFDTAAYDVKNLIIYPVLITHDRVYNMPGLNELVNGWFQDELAQLGSLAQHVRPLVIVDVDTLLAYQDALASKKLVLWDAIEEYYKYIKPLNRKVRTQEDAAQLVYRSVQPFSVFLDDYAAKRNLAPIPAQQLNKLVTAMSDITEP